MKSWLPFFLLNVARPSPPLATLWLLFVVLVSGASAQRVNLAKFQPATASSVNTSYFADFATDGTVSNFHSLRTNNITGNFFTLEITYPRPITIASAHLYSGLIETATPTQVLGSHRYQYFDGSTWVTITSVLNNNAPEVATLFPQPVTATRFRLLGISNGFFTIRELAFFPPNLAGGVEQGYPLGTDVTLNLAHKRPAVSSSAQLVNANGPGYAKNALDGHLDNRSRWLVNPVNDVYASGESLEVDLLSVHSVGSAHIYSGVMDAARVSTSPVTDFTLESWDGTAWRPVPGATITGNTQTARTLTFASPVSTSRIRLITTSATPARLQELLLFPPRAGGYPLGLGVIDAAPSTEIFERYSDSFYNLLNTGSVPALRLALVDSAVVIAAADPADPQRTEWQLLLNYRDGTYRVRNAGTGLCLALAQISPAGGLSVVAEAYSALPHQDWRLVYDVATPSRFSLVNAYSGHALQPLANSTASGTPLVVVPTLAGNSSQQWTASLTRTHPKKGIAATLSTIGTRYSAASGLTYHQDFFNRLDANWSYTWNRQSSDTFPYLNAGFTHNPMLFGGGSGWDHGDSARLPLDRLHRDLQANGKPVSLLGYNEPEHEEQGNVLVEDAIRRWPRFEARDVPLVAPAAANTNGPWFAEFVTQIDAQGLRRDYTAVHLYSSPSSDSYISRLTQIYNDFGRPVWLTEFGNTRWSGTGTWTDAQSYNFLAEFMWRAEGLPWLKRYSIFGYIEEAPDAPPPVSPDPPEAPRSNIIRYDGSLTPLGELYAGWDGVAAVVNDRPYHLHSKKEYRRARNPGLPPSAPTDLVTSASPEVASDGSQWFLIPGTTADTVRIVSTRDGRRLRYFTGTYVGLAPATNFTGQSEWRLVADQHGWFFLSHPQSGARLQINSSGTLLHGSGTATTDEFKWRFIRPAAPDTVGPPAAPASVLAQGGTSAIALSWAPVTDAIRYTVSRATSPSGPWTALNSNVAATTYRDSTALLGTTYHYQLTATSLLAYTSAPSAIVSATLVPPPDPFVAWVAEKLSARPPADQLPGADPDADGLANLLEYALSSDPLTPSSNDGPVCGLSSSPSALTLTFLRARADVTYEVLASPTLDSGAWIVIATNPGAVSLTTPVTVTDSEPINPRRFLRLRVTR